MKIDLINGKTLDTDKLNDIYSQLVETVQSSGIRELSEKINGSCLICARSPTSPNAFLSFHIKDGKDMSLLLDSVNSLLFNVSQGKHRLVVVDVDNVDTE